MNNGRKLSIPNISQSSSGFRFLHHPTDLDEPDKTVTSICLISQHRKSYKPTICAWAYLLCAQRFYIVHRFSIEPFCRR